MQRPASLTRTPLWRAFLALLVTGAFLGCGVEDPGRRARPEGGTSEADDRPQGDAGTRPIESVRPAETGAGGSPAGPPAVSEGSLPAGATRGPGPAVEETAYRQARKRDTLPGYERFLEAFPDTKHEQEVLARMESLALDQAREAGTLDAYRQFIYRFPRTRRVEELFPAVQRICSVRSHEVRTVTACREVLELLPYSEEKADLLRQMEQVEEALKSDRVGYEKHLTAAGGPVSVYQRFPLHQADRQVTRFSDLSADEIWERVSAAYERPGVLPAGANPRLERLHRFFLSYDRISRLRFYRGADALAGQHHLSELSAQIAERRWFEEVLAKVTADPSYGYRESYAVRVIVAIHTAAHFFQLPFPTLFCLIFQESKFDFSVVSGVGAVGLGQLTPIGVKQIEKLRKRQDYEGRLQAAAEHLGNVYRDEVFREMLDRMGFDLRLPALPPSFPESVGHRFPRAVDAAFVEEVRRALQEQGHAYGADLSLVRAKCRLLSRGMVMPDRYVAIHAVYRDAMERRFGSKLGNIYNPETNILYSALLLRYYMKYRWCVTGRELELRPLVRSMAAVISYNQGQTGVRRYLARAQREFPDLDLNEATLEHCRELFTRDRLHAHHGKAGTAREVYRHATSIGRCACRAPERSG